MGAVVECFPSRMDEVAVLPLNSLPLGFRFRPTDEELIDYYLREKINGNGNEVWVIREIDVCKWEPWDLPDLSVIRNKDPEWFFFCPQDRKYPNGHRLNRATTHGYWKATGKDRKIKSGSSLIGMKKTLVFYTGRAPRGKRTNWVMHEYRPTLKELDGTNPGQSPYVLCRLFKKQDETLEVSNCDEVDRTVSTPTTANFSPEEIQSHLAPIAASPSLVTEDDKNRAVPFCISENSEDATSNVITPIDCYSEECDTSDVQNKIVIPTTAEEDQFLNLDIFYDPTTEPLDDKLFSPIHVHIPPELYFPASNESDNRCGLQYQYGTNDVSEFLNSVVNWDELSYDSSCQKPTSTLIDVKDNGSGSDSDVEMSNRPSLQALHAAYPEEAIDRRASIKLEASPQFYSTTTSDFIGDEQKSNIELFQNYNSVVSGDYGTGIKRRTRHERNDSPNKNFADQGTATRRIRLQRKLQVQSHNSNEVVKTGSCAPKDLDSKATIAEVRSLFDKNFCILQETKASENPAVDAKVVDEPQKSSPDSTNNTKISQQHCASACSISKLRDFLLCTRLRYTSKASSNRSMWSAVVFSVVVMIVLVFLANIWEYLKF